MRRGLHFDCWIDREGGLSPLGEKDPFIAHMGMRAKQPCAWIGGSVFEICRTIDSVVGVPGGSDYARHHVHHVKSQREVPAYDHLLWTQSECTDYTRFHPCD